MNRYRDKKDKLKNSIIDNTKKTPLIETHLNQFICGECFNTNLIIEDIAEEKLIGSETIPPCNHCSNNTMQICVRDKEITKSFLEMSTKKTQKEEKDF
ncbi:MAG: hypothetical protein HFJ12_03680 [Bacilli bacterium]|nr:hypothetical protein [Bacilli bacterium]